MVSLTMFFCSASTLGCGKGLIGAPQKEISGAEKIRNTPIPFPVRLVSEHSHITNKILPAFSITSSAIFSCYSGH